MIQTNDAQIKALVNEVLAGELSAVLPLLDRLRELADPRWGRLYSALGRLAIDAAIAAGDRRDREMAAASGPGYQAYQHDRDRRRAWSRFHRAVQRLFWLEATEAEMAEAPGVIAHALDLPALLERSPLLPPYMHGGEGEGEGEGDADPAHDLIW